MARYLIILLLIFCFCPFKFFGQFSWVEIGVNGLTCSQCSRSVEMEIKKLDFVRDVQMDLEHTQGKITFNQRAKVYVEKIAKAVENAGFSVRYLKAGFVFDTIIVNEGNCFPFENRAYQFVKTDARFVKGTVQIKFIGREFLSKAEYKTWLPDLKPKCNNTGKLFYITVI